jgi:hypothetical protein
MDSMLAVSFEKPQEYEKLTLADTDVINPS